MLYKLKNITCRYHNSARKTELDGFRRETAHRVEVRDDRNHNSARKTEWDGSLREATQRVEAGMAELSSALQK